MAESRIPSVKVPPPILSDNDLFQNDKHACHIQKSSPLDLFKLANFDSCHETALHRFTKADIRQAEIINQVDRKFIACRIPKDPASKSKSPAREAQSNSMLVLIDQHAADERIRVEFFLKELFMGFLHSQDQTDANPVGGIRIRELNPPRPVLLTQHEALAIKRSENTRAMLRQWGVRFTESSTKFESTSDSGSTGYSQLLVCSIPEVVSDKVCVLHCCCVCPIVVDIPFVHTMDSCFKEMNCGISSKDSLAKSKVESFYSQILVWICLLKQTKTNFIG